MIDDADLAASELRKNPFSLLPDEGVEIWAGREKLKKMLLRIVVSVRSDRMGLSEFVILHGDYGAGKSHALRYLRWLITSTKRSEFSSPAVFLPTIRTADKASFIDIYTATVDRIGRPEIVRMATAVVERVSIRQTEIKAAATADELRERDFEPRSWARAKEDVLGRYAEYFDLLDNLGRNDDEAWWYIRCSGPKADLSRLGVSGVIESGYDAGQVLGMIVNVGCRTRLSSGRGFWKAFYLFVDEMERIVELDTKSQQSLASGFRDVLNQCPENLCLMFGFTGAAAEVETSIEPGLFDRLTQSGPFLLPQLDKTESVNFLQEVLAAYRTPNAAKGPAHPFSQEALEFIVEHTGQKTPRKLFRNCRIVLDRAAQAGTLKAGESISRAEAQEYLEGDSE